MVLFCLVGGGKKKFHSCCVFFFCLWLFQKTNFHFPFLCATLFFFAFFVVRRTTETTEKILSLSQVWGCFARPRKALLRKNVTTHYTTQKKREKRAPFSFFLCCVVCGDIFPQKRERAPFSVLTCSFFLREL